MPWLKELRVSSWTVYKMIITCTLESLQNVFHEKQMEVDRGVFWCDLEELRRAMMLKRDVLEASAEQAIQELLADEAATKPAGSPATKKATKGKHKKETVGGVRVGNRVTEW